MNDVLDLPRQPGKCPRCDAPLSAPEVRYDGDDVLIDGPGNYWCPACGWEE